MSLISRLHHVLEGSVKDRFVELRTTTPMEELRKVANLENIPLERLKFVERLEDGEYGLLDMEENIFYRTAKDVEREFETYSGTIMTFEDPEIKKWLVANIGGERGITNGAYGKVGVRGIAGEVTYEQALATEDVSIPRNSNIRRFNELVYFKNLKRFTFSSSSIEEISLPYLSIDINGPFYNCQRLKKITTKYGLDINGNSFVRSCPVLSNIDTSKWTFSGSSIERMFEGCISLTRLDLRNLDLGNLSNGQYMFSGCSSLQTLGTSKWNLEKVTDLGSTFDGCRGLTELDSSSWNLIRCSSYIKTFNRCNTLVKIDLTYSKTPISIVNNQDDVLNDCFNLESIVGDHNETDDVSVFNGYNSGEFNCMYYRKNLNLASILAAIRGVGTNNNKRKFKLPIGFDKSRIPQEYKTMLENKNWELA